MRRSAELMPGPLAGLAIAHARAWRIRLSPTGGIELVRPPGPVTTLAAPGRITRVVEASPERHARRRHGTLGVIGLFEGDTPVLSLVMDDWVAHPGALDPRAARTLSGIEPLAQGLGLTVERASDQEVEALRRHRPIRPAARAVRWEDPLLVLAALASFVSMPLASTWAGRGLSVLGALVTWVVCVRFAVRRLRTVALLESTPPPEGRAVVESRLPSEWGGLARQVLQIGPDALVHHARGSEVWVPGPSRGGVHRGIVAAPDLVFLDIGDRVALRLADADGWDLDACERACKAAGIGWEHSPLPVGPEVVPLAPQELGRVPAHATMTEAELGSTTRSTPVLVFVAAALALAGGVAVTVTSSIGLVPLILGIAAAACALTGWWVLRRWWTRDRARAHAAPPPRRGGLT